MKTLFSLLLALLAASASAQLLSQGNGQLPQCAHRCAILLSAQKQCHGLRSLSLSAWSCFCENVYSASGQNVAAICPTSCPNAQDEASVTSWFTANCGSDNGASEHSGTGGGGSGTGTSSTSVSVPSASVTAPGASSDINTNNCAGSWWSCHWQWIIMVIVLALGLTALGVGGRWLKKRHDRKRDQMREGFNSGITSRGAGTYVHDDKDASPAGAGAGGAAAAAGATRDAPTRSRDAFMPYGYNYSRSESSRVGNGGAAEISRGGSPVNEMEKGEQEESSRTGARAQLKKVLVRERNAR